MEAEELESLLNEDKENLKNFIKRLFEDNPNMYLSDFYMLGAVKRSYGNINGLSTLIHSRNMNATRCLLRVHLDTVLRFQAFWYVENIDQFVQKILQGESVSKFKDKLGNNLTDSYLADILSKNHPWAKMYIKICVVISIFQMHIFGMELIQKILIMESSLFKSRSKIQSILNGVGMKF
ncbi:MULTISPECIES: hypothetical protein [unclassified Acinetobacter]|uniref:hypothetical protein n=1 Tax=unclassified Acinetobacter TaxID=196816 RepID=UPI0015D31D80|nr:MULTISPECIES: hypothetical protein [unclassified Acinetobacter]